ncbi:MAG: flagellin, partial [Lachnospiraceae bacterium]|nr:flagellin [Lachnospiraceae bacterium]
MKINSNITAYITNNALLSNEKLFAKSTEKLSTGFKINRAGDDPTGYAISGRMREQIKTLEKCDINATTGKS